MPPASSTPAVPEIWSSEAELNLNIQSGGLNGIRRRDKDRAQGADRWLRAAARRAHRDCRTRDGGRDISLWPLMLPLAVFGYGQGLVMAPLSGAVLATVPKSNAGSASGLYGTVQQIGNAAGVALVSALYIAVTRLVPNIWR